MEARDFEGFYAGNEREQGKNRAGDHEDDGEVDHHGVGMAAEERHPFYHPVPELPGRRGLGRRCGGLRLFLEDPHLGIAFEDFLAVGGVRELPGEIVSGVVLAHVVAVRPQAAAADVVDLAPEGDVDRSAIGAGAGSQFRQGEFPP